MSLQKRSRFHRALPARAIVAGAAVAGLLSLAAGSGTASASSVTSSTFPTHGGVLFGGTDALTKQSAALGRNLAIVRVYYHIGGTFPLSVDIQHMQQGSTVLVSMDSSGQTYANIAAGQYDTQISAFLASVNAAALTYHLSAIFFTFEHEPDDTSKASLGSPAQFVAAWDHVHQLAAAANLDWDQGAGGRIVWALILTHHTYAVGTNAGGYWPGPGEVDVAAADGYNSAGCGTSPAQTPAQLFSPLLSFAAANGGLPVVIAEWGSNAAQPAAQVSFITQMQAYLKAHHTVIKAADYWDQASSNCNYAVDKTPGSLAALKTLGAQAFMQGTAHL